MSKEVRVPVRDVARRAVQAELVAVAQLLFAEHGYEATTTEMIASAAGMARRTVFRYFASKEEIVLGKYALLGEQLVDALREQPAREPLWGALRQMFATFERADDADSPYAIERVVEVTPSLRAGYLYRLDLIQRAVVHEARARAERAGSPFAADDPTPEALVGSAFACVMAARDTFRQSSGTWAEMVERALGSVRVGGAENL